MFKLSSNFIGNFKTGDNIVLNLGALKLIYKHKAGLDNEVKQYLNKPATIIIVSVAEAVLDDLLYRVYHFTTEGVAGLKDIVIQAIREKNYDEFTSIIDCAKKHQIFGGEAEFYEQLHELRKLRNRVHIQNKKKYFEQDEAMAFSDERLVLAEKALEKILRELLRNHSRGNSLNHVEDFELPWDPHFT